MYNDSAIKCDEIIDAEKTKSIPKNITCKTQNSYLLLSFLLITIALLIAVSIFYYLIKYLAKQNYLLPFHFTNNDIKQVFYWQYKLKMSNKIKDINIKNHISQKNHILRFRMILSIWKILIQIILKQINTHTKIFLLTKLDMWQ